MHRDQVFAVGATPAPEPKRLRRGAAACNGVVDPPSRSRASAGIQPAIGRARPIATHPPPYVQAPERCQPAGEP